MKLGKYSFGIGDRFGKQGEAQLNALIKAKNAGIEITPVWNKSFREHQIVRSKPYDTRTEANAATTRLHWHQDYFVDADHINLENVDPFLDSSDFFTIDVADYIGIKASEDQIEEFMNHHQRFLGAVTISGIDQSFFIKKEKIKAIAANYLCAIEQAEKIFHYIQVHKASEDFIVEVSMDETDQPQTPVDLLFILAAISEYKIPVNTIAPKFTGDFFKGVDYVGDPGAFANEFEQDLFMIQFAKQEFNLNSDLKLSVHSGSDKFSIYPMIKNILKKHNAGVHIKTAGTTWLEELIGLSLAGGNGLKIAKQMYRSAFGRIDELCRPYAAVINIDKNNLPSPKEVELWDEEKFSTTLRHDQSNPSFNRHFRQLLHVGYRIAAELGDTYYQTLEEHKEIIGQNVTENLFERHIKKIFL
jgi:hypothetical protein